MSTPPPPPPPSPPPPFANGTQAAWDRQTLRNQRRAAVMAARQQRMQLRSMRRQSLLGPLMLVSIGVVFLLVEMGRLHAASALGWLAHWWPMLLVAAGLVLLAEWGADTWVAGRNGAMLPRRSLGPGGTLLLILLTIAGISATGFQHGTDWIQRNFDKDVPQSWNLEPLFGQHKETDNELNAPLDKGAVLTVINGHGNVSVNGDSPDNLVHIRVHQQFVAWRGDDLHRREQRERPLLNERAGGLTLQIASEGNDQADLIIQVPHESGFHLGAGKGDVDISQLRGPVQIQGHSGDIALTGLTGHVEIAAQDDHASITAHSVSGDITVNGRSGDITFSDITGPTNLHGDFFGTTHLERITGPLDFRSSFTTLACSGVPGELNIEGRSELQAENVEGPVVLSTSDRNITLSEVRKGATVSDRNGSVTLTFAGPLSPSKVSTSDGSIEIFLPSGSPLSLSAKASDGQIKNNLGLTGTVNGDDSSLRAQVLQGGPTLTLETANGDINIETEARHSERDRDGSSDGTTPDDDAGSATHHRPRRPTAQ